MRSLAVIACVVLAAGAEHAQTLEATPGGASAAQPAPATATPGAASAAAEAAEPAASAPGATIDPAASPPAGDAPNSHDTAETAEPAAPAGSAEAAEPKGAPAVEPGAATDSSEPTQESAGTAQAPRQYQPPPGYRPQIRTSDGKKVYCRSESRLGTRFDKKVCYTEIELEQVRARNESEANDITRRSRVCGSAEACN